MAKREKHLAGDPTVGEHDCQSAAAEAAQEPSARAYFKAARLERWLLRHCRPAQRRTRENVALLAVLLAVAGAITAWGAFDLRAEARSYHPPGIPHTKQGAPQLSRSLTVAIVPLIPARGSAALSAPDGQAGEFAAQMLSPAELKALGDDLAQLYPFTYEVTAPLEIPEEYYDATRRQYRIDQLLTYLIKQRGQGSYRCAGVLTQDVYAPGYNYLFGQARIYGPACVSSAARMGGTVIGGRLTPSERWHSIVRHELGHALGLPHAERGRSVMRFANSLPELDHQATVLSKREWEMLEQYHNVVWER